LASATLVLAAASAWVCCGRANEGVDGGGQRSAVAHLELIKGVVTLERDGKEAPAELGYLYAQDQLVTGVNGEARLRFPGGRTLQMKPDSTFLLDETASGLILHVSKGSIVAEMGAQDEGRLKAMFIETPFGSTELGTGQNGLSLTVGRDGAKVQVLAGKIELLDQAGGRQELGKGGTVELTVGKLARVNQDGDQVMELPALQLVIGDVGLAEVRHKGQKRWAPLKRGQVLDPGDAIRVRQGRSIVKAGDNAIAVTAGSEAAFQGAARDGAVETSTVDLARGALSLSLAQGKRTRVTVGGVQLDSKAGGQFTVLKTADGLEVAALAGDMTAKKGDAEQAVLAGQVARLGARGADVHAAGTSELVLPSRTGTKVFHAGTVGEVTLSWPGEKKDYVVEVAGDPDFNQKLLLGTVHQPFVTVEGPRQGGLYWRVFEPDGKTQLERGSAVFRPEFTSSTSTFHDTVQEGSDRTTIYYQNTLPAVTLTFRNEPNAAKYRVRVFKAADLNAPAVDRTSATERVQLEPGTLPEGNYLWSATPMSEAGEELRGGKMTKLDIVYDNAVPSLMVRTPKNGDAYAGNKVQAAGVATVGSKVLINGKSATLDDKGRFDEPVQPVGRPPALVFRLVRPNAFDVVLVRSLRRGAR
jgi:hypothetical protein